MMSVAGERGFSIARKRGALGAACRALRAVVDEVFHGENSWLTSFSIASASKWPLITSVAPSGRNAYWR
jgi:hypothetical protein